MDDIEIGLGKRGLSMREALKIHDHIIDGQR
jgi:hypothetical protein